MAWGIFKNLFQRIKVVATKLKVVLQNNEWWIASYIFEWMAIDRIIVFFLS